MYLKELKIGGLILETFGIKVVFNKELLNTESGLLENISIASYYKISFWLDQTTSVQFSSPLEVTVLLLNVVHVILSKGNRFADGLWFITKNR